MNIQLKHRVIFTKPVEVKLDSGSIDKTWATLLTVWAQLKPLKSHERYSHQKLSIKSDFELTVRRSSQVMGNVTTECRVAFGARIFEVVSQPTDYKMDNKFLTILLQEVDV